jgi:multidrug efflux pump subunit AcrB
MQQPLAIAMLGGVSLSMLFSLFSLIAVPLLYLLLARFTAASESIHAPADR